MDRADGLQGILVVYINQPNMSTARVIKKEHDMTLAGGKTEGSHVHLFNDECNSV